VKLFYAFLVGSGLAFPARRRFFWNLAGWNISGWNKAGLLLATGALLAFSVHARAADGSTNLQDTAERALMQGRVDQAVHQLQNQMFADPHDVKAHLLLCRAFYSEEQADEAIAACQSAVQAEPNSSEAEEWLGRAYGLKASRAGLVASFQLARKVRAALEAAVTLDPSNGAAVDDLSEYYIAAPAIVGGGVDKAAALAKRVQGVLPQQAHRIRALIADKESDLATAEREYRAAVAVANRPDAWADLGAFYGEHKQYDQAVQALERCILLDRAKDASVVDAASTLNDIHRDPQLAEQALRGYLSGHAQSDAAPAPKVEVLLARMLAADGNTAAAKIEVDKALQLASNYDPAKRELQSLQHVG
jgi:Tfp pilus assembly protein PilF